MLRDTDQIFYFGHAISTHSAKRPRRQFKTTENHRPRAKQRRSIQSHLGWLYYVLSEIMNIV